MVDYKGAVPNFQNWGKMNQCTGTAAAMPDTTSCQTYPTCADGVETILCTVQDGTHCANYSTFHIPDAAWPVLQRHAAVATLFVIDSFLSLHKAPKRL